MFLRRLTRASAVALCAGLLLFMDGQCLAQTALADQPIFSAVAVPGNVAVVLSVEYPTAISAAYGTRTYTPATTYSGYFNPAACYSYAYSTSDPTTAPATTPASWFTSTSAASPGHTCSGLWSGNFLNWATTPSIDGFRWAMTGGYRVIDTAGSGSTPGVTVLEKAFASVQGGTASGNGFPDSSIPVEAIAGATPFGSTLNKGPLLLRIQGLGNKMRFLGSFSPTYTADWYANQTFTPPIATTTTMVGTSSAVAPTPTSNPNGAFSVRLKGTLTAPTTGAYIFQVNGTSTTASFYINGVKLIGPATFNTTPGYNVSPVVYYNAGDTLNLVVEINQVAGAIGPPSTTLSWGTPTPSVPWVRVASEFGTFNVTTASQVVRFGAGTSFVSKTITGPVSNYQCSVANFGSDPAYGYGKECDFQSDWTQVAAEGPYPYFSVAGPSQIVRFGTGTSWVTKTFTGPAYGVACSVANFPSDPAPGYNKECDEPGATLPLKQLGTSTDLDTAPVVAYTGEGTAPSTQNSYELFGRVKVCDPSAGGGLELNCVQYGSTYKPQGLMQSYSGQLRYSVFGYLNDPDPLRDAGVLRAQQKAIGPYTIAAAGAASAANGGAEWNATNGTLVLNPDTADASATGVSQSGVMNYINGFGETLRLGYKVYDPVSELYYAAARYFKGLPNVPQWSNTSALSATARTTAIDSFPVITTWNDPLQYSCQKNFILGMGDANTWNDKNVPGNTAMSTEPTLPALVASDPSPTTPFTSIAKINAMEGTPASWGTTASWSSSGSSGNSDLMAGLAYDMHTSDIRPDDASKPQTVGLQTVDTYWVDVQERNVYQPTNVYYMATKYGGFTIPEGFAPYSSSTTALKDSWWWNGVDTDASTGQKRPRNYFPGSRPDLMQAGLSAAFANIVATLKQTTTGFSTALPQVSASGGSSYATTYDPSTWSGDVSGAILSFDAAGAPSASLAVWSFAAKLASQASGTGWVTSRRIATWNGTTGVQFTTSAITPGAATTITPAQLALLDTGFVAGDDSVAYLGYLRGNRDVEISGLADATHVYRARGGLVGDITDAKPVVVGAPSYPYSDSANPGYSAYKTTWKSRRTVVYVASNDGMLHAINGALSTTSSSTVESDTNAGTEMFAYVPSALFQGSTGAPNTDGLASLGKPVFVHHNMVDSTPQSFDVDFGNTGGTVGSPDWRTIIVGGLGKGGKSYYALDVTDPVSMVAAGEVGVAAKVLWEFSNPAGLGYTFGEPLAVKLKRYGWVIVLPSGYNNSDGVGHLFILNPRTGALLETITMPSGSAGLAHVNAYVPDATDSTAESLYAGDLGGNLWRVDVRSTAAALYPSPVLLARVTDSNGSPQPITVRPIAQIDPSTSRRFVLFGTGRLLDPTDMSSAQTQSFYAIMDGNSGAASLTPASGGAFPITRSNLTNNSTPGSGAALDLGSTAGWYEDLFTTPTSSGPQPRVTADATTLYNSVAWSAFVPNSDPCSVGGYSLVYAARFGNASSILLKGGLPTASLDTSQINGLARGTVTDLSFVSVDGTARLVMGQNNSTTTSSISIANLFTTIMRRINWREVPGDN